MTDLIDFFDRQHDGTWTCVRSFPGMLKGRKFLPGDCFMGVDWHSALEQMAWQCGG